MFIDARVTPAKTSRMAVLRLKGQRLLKKIGRIAVHPKLGSRPKRAAGDSAALFSNLFVAQTKVFPHFQAERDRMTYGLPGIPDVNSPSNSISGIGRYCCESLFRVKDDNFKDRWCACSAKLALLGQRTGGEMTQF